MRKYKVLGKVPYSMTNNGNTYSGNTYHLCSEDTPQFPSGFQGCEVLTTSISDQVAYEAGYEPMVGDIIEAYIKTETWNGVKKKKIQTYTKA